MIEVVNIAYDKYDVYIGRTKEKFHYGNPFGFAYSTLCSIRVKNREEAIEECRFWIKGEKWLDIEQERRQWILDNLDKLKDKKLACFCKPKACHGDILKMLIEDKENL